MQLPSEWLLKDHGDLQMYLDQGLIWRPQAGSMLYVARKYRPGLYWSGLKHIIGPQLKTKLDFSKFVHGERWAECYGVTIKDSTGGLETEELAS